MRVFIRGLLAPARGGAGVIRSWVVGLLIALGALPGASLHAGPRPPDVNAVLAKLDDLYKSSGSIGKVEMTVVRPGSTRTLVMRVWTRGEDRALIIIDSPAREAGTATLRVGQNLWNYLPRIARTIRIPPSAMLSPWMGSDFTNDDLVQESSYREDYNARITGRSTDPPGWQLRLDAKPGTVGLWRRIDLVVSDDGWLPLVERHYDRRGDLARVMRFDQVRTMGGRRIPTRVTVTPVDKQGHRTVMRYLEMQFNANVPESTFSLQRLERNR
jgi:outer membrane lipoprotein-sorting protein